MKRIYVVLAVAIVIVFFALVGEVGATVPTLHVDTIESYVKDNNERVVWVNAGDEQCPREWSVALVVEPTQYIDEITLNHGVGACDGAATYDNAHWLALVMMDYVTDGFFPIGVQFTNMTSEKFFAEIDAEINAVRNAPFPFGPFHINNIESAPGRMTIYFGGSEKCERGVTAFEFETETGNPVDYWVACYDNVDNAAGEDAAGYLVEQTIGFIHEGHPVKAEFVNMDIDTYLAMVVEACENAGCNEQAIGTPPTMQFRTLLSVIFGG